MKIILESKSAQGWMKNHGGDPTNRLLGYSDSALHDAVSRWQELLPCHENFQPAVPPSKARWKTHPAPTQAHCGFVSMLCPPHGTRQHARTMQCRSAHGKPPHWTSASAPAPPREDPQWGNSPFPEGSLRVAGCQVHLQSICLEDRDCLSCWCHI